MYVQASSSPHASMSSAADAPQPIDPTSTNDELFDLPAFPPPPQPCSEAPPRVAVVMPLFNACTPTPLVLHTALCSILSQTYSAIHFVIVDDASTDSTASLLRLAAAHDGRIRTLRNDTQRGVSFSLTRAIHSLDPSIDYIARMDGDDISTPDRLQQQLDYLQQHSDIHVLGSAVTVLSSASLSTPTPTQPTTAPAPHSASSRVIGHPLSPAMVDWSMPLYCSLAHPATFMRRSVFSSHSYPVAATLAASSPCEDYALWLQLLRSSHRLANLSQPLLTLRQHSGRVSALRQAEQRSEALRLATQHIRETTRLRVAQRTVARMREPKSVRWREEASEVVALLLSMEEAWKQKWVRGGGKESDGEWQEVRADVTARVGEAVTLAVQLGSRGTAAAEEGDGDREDDTLCEQGGNAPDNDWRAHPPVPAVSSEASALMSLWLARGGQSATVLSALLLSGRGR